jgi:hypothetical protein
MRSRVVRRLNVPLLVDTAIALAFVVTATFFALVMEYCVGRGELTQAESRLLAGDVRVAHSTVRSSDGNQENREPKESKNGKWWSTEIP